MFRLSVFVVVLLATAAIGQEPAVSVQPEPHPTSSSTTAKPTTTTLAPITTSTANPNTTTTTTTTTVKPTSTTTPTTTVKPTTTTGVPTTTAKPGPVPQPTAGLWSVTYAGSNRTCLVVRAAIQIELPLSQNKSMRINLPQHANGSGVCSDAAETLTLQWDSGNQIILTFAKTNTSKFELERFEADLNVTLPAQNATIWRLENNRTEFATPLDNSYKCNKEQTFNLTTVQKPQLAYLYLTDVQIQAFRNTTGEKFASAIDCESATQRDVIPIVVGCVLAALVVLVLVGYLFGRRRCQARGYLSM